MLGTTDIEVLIAGLSPLRLARLVALRLRRKRQREADRARLAGELLAASVGKRPGKRFSMADAALARVAAGGVAVSAGATNGSDVGGDGSTGENVQPARANAAECALADDIPDKRKLRGEARAAMRAEKAKREPLPDVVTPQVRGNGRVKRAVYVRGGTKQGGG